MFVLINKFLNAFGNFFDIYTETVIILKCADFSRILSYTLYTTYYNFQILDRRVSE